MRWQVREWQFDTTTREVTGPGGSKKLRPRVYRTFRLLVEKAPSVVSKAELLDAVWEAQAVSDGAIAQVVRELRTILGDDPADPCIIATRHRLGYQCIALVARIEDDATPDEPISIAGSVATEPADPTEPVPSVDPPPSVEPALSPEPAPAPTAARGNRRRWL